jgi:hypothetical protein
VADKAPAVAGGLRIRRERPQVEPMERAAGAMSAVVDLQARAEQRRETLAADGCRRGRCRPRPDVRCRPGDAVPTVGGGGFPRNVPGHRRAADGRH